MYTRSYPDDERNVPEGYSGNAFSEKVEKNVQNEPEKKDSVSAGSFFEKLLPTSFGNILSGNLLKNFRLGWEELLIIGVAALLFFSRDGDKECALMLILLIFIS